MKEIKIKVMIFLDVLRDFLSCIPRMPHWIYGRPIDKLSEYAQIIAIHGVNSKQAEVLFQENSRNKYFCDRATVLKNSFRRD
jgi:hypothetical protein